MEKLSHKVNNNAANEILLNISHVSCFSFAGSFAEINTYHISANGICRIVGTKLLTRVQSVLKIAQAVNYLIYNNIQTIPLARPLAKIKL